MLQEGFGGGARAVGRGRARGGGRGQRLAGEGAVEEMVADAAQRDRERSDAVHLASSARVTCTETHGRYMQPCTDVRDASPGESTLSGGSKPVVKSGSGQISTMESSSAKSSGTRYARCFFLATVSGGTCRIRAPSSSTAASLRAARQAPPRHHAPCTVHPAPCIQHPAPYIVHPAPGTVHPASGGRRAGRAGAAGRGGPGLHVAGGKEAARACGRKGRDVSS